MPHRPVPDRRIRRSRFRRRALRFLVEHRSRLHGLAMVAVADSTGRVLAASCGQPDPREIAAVAPILDPSGCGGSVRMFGLSVWVQKMDGPSGELFLSAMGDPCCARACVSQLSNAVTRILG